MAPSPEQTRCISALTGSASNLLISACAGGAKTTTMVLMAKALGATAGKVVALAFNKDAATALEAKMPYYVESSTFHSHCYTAIGQHLGRKPKPDGKRCSWLLKDMCPDWKVRRELESPTLTLVSRFKSTTDPVSAEALANVAERFDIEVGTQVLGYAERILLECLKPNPKSIDFDDMLWLAYHWQVRFSQIAYAFLDEAQDTNAVQRALLQRILQPASAGCANLPRLIAVGDPHQSIYGFRGADHEAMTLLRSEFAMEELALSVSYRCSQAVVREAQKYL
jgi:superfamily I DNA/RNA helicase